MSPLDRGRAPEAGPIRPFDFPHVERRQLANGLDLRVARMSRLPVVSVELFMRAGEADVPEERAGLAVLAGDALEGGTHRRSGSELAEALERLGAELDVSAGWEGTSVSLSCLADRMGEAFALLAEAVLEPSFPEDEVDRTRERQLAAIRQRAMDPAALAGVEASRRYYAPGTPYARPLSGTSASVEPLARSDLQGYAAARYRPARGGLVVVGDVAADEVAEMVEGRLGAWDGTPPASRDFEAAPATRERRITVVHRPGSVQSEIRVGHVGAARSDPDFFPLMVLNLLFGGTFTSRLNLNLRERNGFTYGVRSRFAFRSRPGPFQVSTAVAADVTSAAVGEIASELERLVREGPTQEEVAAARDFAAGVFPLRIETTGQVAGRIAELVVYGLPDDYHRTYRDRVRAVTASDAGAAGRRHLRPAEAQIVIVGDADSVAPGLETLGLGPVDVVTSDGR